MSLAIECEKCKNIFTIKLKSTKKQKIKVACRWCKVINDIKFYGDGGEI